MIVIETRSQIVEMTEHKMALAQSSSTTSHLINSERSSSFSLFAFNTFFRIQKGNQITINVSHYLLNFNPECSKLLATGVPITTLIHEEYMRLTPILYPCTIEFSLMCLTVSSPIF